jgi:LmbE family N-acetylglucosaminyl deacetylase
VVTLHTRTEDGIQRSGTLRENLGAEKTERILLVSAHDDDPAVGMGMLIAQAVREGFEVYPVIASNGGMGYCDLEQRGRIAQIRARETIESYRVLGVPEENIHVLGFNDGALYNYIGRFPAGEGDPEVEGFTGMENHFTWILRKLKPQRVFLHAASDLHPDHQAVCKDFLISVFHASGDIWPELGAPIEVPEVYEYPIYVNLEGEPDTMVEGDADLLETKLRAIACYRSQKQIDTLVEGVRRSGPVEFFRNLNFAFYDPTAYRRLFTGENG